MAENEKGRDEKSQEFANALRTRPVGGRKAAATTEESAGRSSKTKLIGGQFDEAVSRQLKTIASREGKTMLELLAEGINRVFEDRGEPPIARGSNR